MPGGCPGGGAPETSRPEALMEGAPQPRRQRPPPRVQVRVSNLAAPSHRAGEQELRSLATPSLHLGVGGSSPDPATSCLSCPICTHSRAVCNLQGTRRVAGIWRGEVARPGHWGRVAGRDMRSRDRAESPSGTGGPGRRRLHAWGPGSPPGRNPVPRRPAASRTKVAAAPGAGRPTGAAAPRPWQPRRPTQAGRAFGPFRPSALGSFRRGRRRWRGRGGGRAW